MIIINLTQKTENIRNLLLKRGVNFQSRGSPKGFIISSDIHCYPLSIAFIWDAPPPAFSVG
jgi:hypothetical protein